MDQYLTITAAALSAMIAYRFLWAVFEMLCISFVNGYHNAQTESDSHRSWREFQEEVARRAPKETGPDRP